MILLLPAEKSASALEASLTLARHLSDAGHLARVDAALLPEELSRGQKYDLARLGTDATAEATEYALMVVAAERLSQATLDRLSQLTATGGGHDVTVVGRFDALAARIAAQAKVAYANGAEPRLVDLEALLGPLLVPATLTIDLCPPAVKPARPDTPPTLLVHARADRLLSPPLAQALPVLRHQPGLRLLVLPETGARDRLRGTPAEGLPLTDLFDQAPGALAGLADAIAVFDGPDEDERLSALLCAMIAEGKAVIDCTAAHVLCATGAPALSGPEEPAALWPYLERTVLPARADIAEFIAKTPWSTRHALPRFLNAAGLQPAPQPTGAPQRARRTLFLPTNGVGLGHAQRCGLIARAMGNDSPVAFAAFPSCVPLLNDLGFDCLPLVPKSADHADPYANDILTYRRLAGDLAPDDLLVFDGGYIFDSIARVIAERRLRAVWVRRGLWQAGQLEDHRRAQMARESLFDRIIQPLEAFDELNDPVIYGSPVRAVGPIVQEGATDMVETQRTRDDLARRLGRHFGELVVTMLGAGHAADRTAQTLALCHIFERRPDCLHLVVTWPGAPSPAALFGWQNTRVVQTRRALGLMQAADLVVSAAGYNSFHEILYHQVPAILIPQMSPFMDDQRRRARAVAARDLAVAVEAEELLRLTREVQAMLDGGKAAAIRARLAATVLPERGTRAAAALIRAEGDAR